MYTCNPSIQEVEAGGSVVQGHSLLHDEYGANLRYTRLHGHPYLPSGVSGWPLLEEKGHVCQIGEQELQEALGEVLPLSALCRRLMPLPLPLCGRTHRSRARVPAQLADSPGTLS